jgi:hypothetical protein
MFDVRWVHVFEDDTPQVEVYRPETADVPLSRRPREAFELRRDGTADIFSGGPDDRPAVSRGRWTDTPDGMLVTDDSTGASFRIVKRAPGQLIVSRR